MALVDFSAPSAPLLTRAVRAIGNAYATHRQAQSRRTTLQSILYMEDHRLNDLGITRHDIIEALNRR